MRKNSLLTLSLMMALGVSSNALSAEIETNSALMQAMDKVTGRVNKITVPVNTKVTYGDFSLVLRSCKKRPAEETPENFAFVDVTDKSFGSEEYNIFRGWILSSAPGINAIEHPIYDIWLLECIDSENTDAKVLSKEELDARDNLPTKDFLQEKNNAEVKNDSKKDEEPKAKKVIHIKEFINEDRDIERNIEEQPILINKEEVIDENKPQNLLDFTNKNIVKEDSDATDVVEEDDLSKAIDAEIRELNKD
ncbi:MAG: DUF2155 domain-containing protein [Alphaproteobacteria bacterium]|nr:DUF2155 domain-containing protein [Alphaproteobacteria bacterium]